MLFGTAGIRGDLTQITPQFALALGRSVAEFAERRNLHSVMVGKDGRTSSDMLSEAVTAGILSQNMPVTAVGPVPTPGLAFACDQCGIMITASHNPPDNNGMKVFLEHRELFPQEEREVETIFEMSPPGKRRWDLPSVENEDILPQYREAVLSYVKREFATISSQKKVVVDCGNGMGSLATPDILKRMGCTVITLFEEITGRFERPPEPSEKNISVLKEKVLTESADLGIAHDGDADRINVIDETGNVIPEDSVIALLAGHYAGEGDCVVTSLDTSIRIDEHVSKKGGKTQRVMLGNLHEGVSQYKAVFAGEPWKHVHARFGNWIDGIVSAAVLVKLIQDRKASQLCSEIHQYPQKKINLKTGDRDRLANFFRDNLNQFKDIKEVVTISGMRANFCDSSWILVRPSGTEPKVRIIIEGVNQHRFDQLQKFVSSILIESGCQFQIV